MVFNFDTTGTLDDKVTPEDKIQYLIANLITLDWDNLDIEDWDIIISDLIIAQNIADKHINILVQQIG